MPSIHRANACVTQSCAIVRLHRDERTRNWLTGNLTVMVNLYLGQDVQVSGSRCARFQLCFDLTSFGYAIVELSMATDPTYWVVVPGIVGDGEISVIDPWTGKAHT